MGRNLSSLSRFIPDNTVLASFSILYVYGYTVSGRRRHIILVSVDPN
jgi:hypothetical protein